MMITAKESREDPILRFMHSKKAYIVSIFVLFLIFQLSSSFFTRPCFAQPWKKKQTVNIGILLDGDDKRNTPFISMLRSELNALLGSSYDIHIRDKHIFKGQWTFASIDHNYDQLTLTPDIHIIIGIGAITGSVISKKKNYKKPVIAMGIVDTVVQGISPMIDNKTGIHNLTYILGNRSILNDLETFHQVYPYKRLGIIYHSELGKTITQEGRQSIERLMAENHSNFTKIPIKKNINEVFEKLNNIDAVYISYLGKFEGNEKQDLIERLNQQRMPSFGSSIADARSGLLAAMAPDDIIIKIIRRITLNIEAILEGKNPSEFKIATEFEKNLTINMKTAAQIGFSPKFTILSQAELINEYHTDAKRTINLVDVMKEAVKNSLDLEVSQTYVQNAEHDISKAQTDYYPYLSAGLDGIIIDEKRADRSNGTLAERTTTGKIEANQLIYSDQVFGNIASQKHIYQATRLEHENAQLDIIYTATESYFRILKSKTSRKIFKDNIDLIKRNLKTAEQREVIGYSGRSDVLRWKSELAKASTELLTAKQEVLLAKNDLNRILNRNQEEPFLIEDTAMDDTIFSAYSANSVEKYIDNQKSLDVFTRFFIDQCIENSVEIKGLNEKKFSLERSVVSLKRKHYLPTINLLATQDHVFSRDGAGSDTAGSNPVDNPWSAGIYLNLPIFEGGSTTINIKKALVEISRIQKQKSILAQNIENNARIALSDTVVKMVNLESSQQTAKYAKQSLELVQDAYAKGTVSVVELADAQNNALTGELSAISSIYEYLITLFKMERVYGKFSLLLPMDSQEKITYRFREYTDNTIKK